MWMIIGMCDWIWIGVGRWIGLCGSIDCSVGDSEVDLEME
jgi:hypothetical protein